MTSATETAMFSSRFPWPNGARARNEEIARRSRGRAADAPHGAGPDDERSDEQFDDSWGRDAFDDDEPEPERGDFWPDHDEFNV
jgi:hypothetical protein